MIDDWDLENCLVYNPQEFVFDDVDTVLAVIDGENDGSNWEWLLLLKDGRFAALQGGCNYTGWDCQSNADSQLGETLDEVLAFFQAEDTVELLRQVRKGRNKTRREQIGEDLGSL